MNDGIAEELHRLAALRDRGVISDRELSRHKDRLLAAKRPGVSLGRLVGAAGAAGVAVLSAVIVAIAAPSHTPTHTAAPAQIQEASVTSSQVQQAINWATSRLGQNYDDGLCLQFVSDAWQSAGVSLGGRFSTDDPVTYWAHNYGGFSQHPSTGSYGTPPAGAILFWGATRWNAYGHAALSLGGGEVVSTSAYPYSGGVPGSPLVFSFNLAQRNPSTYSYLGWILPGNVVSDPAPAPTPAPTPTPAPLVVSSGGGGVGQSGSVTLQGGSGAIQGGSGSIQGGTTPIQGGGAPDPQLATPTSAPASASAPEPAPVATHAPAQAPPASGPPSPAVDPTVTLAQGPAAPAGYRYAISLAGFAPGTAVAVTCYDSVSPNGFFTFSVTTSGSGSASTASQCFSGDGPDHWVTAGGVTSNHVTWSAAPAPAPTPVPTPAPAPAQTWAETTGGVTHTWSDYTNAGGSEGPSIPSNATVSIACKVPGFTVADGDTWWYRVASSPWGGSFYASADAFYNNGATSGSLHGTPFVDANVANC